MQNIKKTTKEFVSNLLDQEYAKAQEQLQALVNEKIKQKIRAQQSNLNKD